MSVKKTKKSRLFDCIKKAFLIFVFCAFIINPASASVIDSLNLAQFVPSVLEIMMNIAMSLYDYFVGNGTGLIYVFIYAFLGFYIFLYLVKMHLPKDWLSFIGFSGGGEMWDGSATGWTIANNIMKPCLRAIIAAVLLLQVKPEYVTEWLVNPFLEFGSVYTKSVLQNINNSYIDVSDAPPCPASIADADPQWISTRSCDFLIQPVHIISKENNKVIKYGFGFLKTGLVQIASLFLHGGEGFLNIITGILLLTAFVSANLFMALLIIQCIFDFCIALIMYPFNVLAWVVRKSDKWFDILPAFDQIITALKKLVITMIACAFILCINVALIRALFNWSSSVFVAAAGGTYTTNVPSITNTATNFGEHSVLWLSSLLTFFILRNIFQLTRDRLENVYTKDVPKTMYKDATSYATTTWEKIKKTPDTIKTIWKAGKKLKK